MLQLGMLQLLIPPKIYSLNQLLNSLLFQFKIKWAEHHFFVIPIRNRHLLIIPKNILVKLIGTQNWSERWYSIIEYISIWIYAIIHYFWIMKKRFDLLKNLLWTEKDVKKNKTTHARPPSYPTNTYLITFTFFFFSFSIIQMSQITSEWFRC